MFNTMFAMVQVLLLLAEPIKVCNLRAAVQLMKQTIK
jgi:hypothetical protein